MSTLFPSLSQGSRAFPLPTISEDTLHYVLHLPRNSSVQAEALAVLITDYVESLLIQPWLWNKDAWELKAVEGHPYALEGRMRVGDAVDDEWAVVWLLRQVSEKWKDLVIRDSDGEFLLIEAANELPAWVSPDNAENRLWLSNGHLHLIPLSVRSSSTGLPRHIPDNEEDERRFDPENYLNEEDGVSAVRTGRYQADLKVEDAVWDRISGYPGALRTHQHRTKAYLPEKVAKALAVQPDLIQKAVEAFYVRDPAQLRAASRMTHFPPSPAILSSVLMTRAAYAQLQGQVFHPPRVFGPEWHVREGQELDDERRWRDIGVKIATGFEIMYREGGSKGRSGQKKGQSDSEVPHGAEYERFVANLQRAGFFGEELQGSEKWKQREAEALKGWRNVNNADDSSHRPSFAYLVDRAVERAPDPTTLQVSTATLEDSDKWLEVDPDELDGMLQRAAGVEAVSQGEKAEVSDEQGKALGNLAKKVEEFVGGQGDLAGAQFADELSDEDMDDDSDEQEDAPEITPAQKAERLKNLVAPLEGEWGRKLNASLGPNLPTIIDTKKDESAPKMRPPLFAKQVFDGAESDSDDEVDEADLPPVGTIGRKISQMKWGDGGPQIEEIEDDEAAEQKAINSRKFDMGDDIDEIMRRKVWGDDGREDEGEDAPIVVDDEEMDVDMALEQEEFLKFARDALGIDDEMWTSMMKSRKERGDYVPEFPKVQPGTNDALPGGPRSAQHLPLNAGSASVAPAAQPQEPSNGAVNMDLDSFDKVMAAMDAELAHKKGTSAIAPAPVASQAASTIKGKCKFNALPDLPSEADLDDMDDEDLAAMDRELRAALKNAGVDDLSDDGIPEAQELDEDGKREYRMMKDFLESYQSQGGQSGVVGNLFGRLGEEQKK